LCPGRHRRAQSINGGGEGDEDGRRSAAVYVLAAVACLTGAAATVTGGALVCRYAHLCQRVKGLRYRWQIRYREVSNTDTVNADAKN